MAKNNIHDRHSVPQPDENFDYAQEKPTPKVEKLETPKGGFTWPGKTAKDQQAARDAHFKENGVKADGTGGKVPESEQ